MVAEDITWLSGNPRMYTRTTWGTRWNVVDAGVRAYAITLEGDPARRSKQVSPSGAKNLGRRDRLVYRQPRFSGALLKDYSLSTLKDTRSLVR